MSISAPDKFVEHMEQKVSNLLGELELTETYRTLFLPDTPATLIGAIIRNIMLETASYGHHITEASFTALGRLPKTRPQLLRPLAEQLLDEVFHPEIALKDVSRLGGKTAQPSKTRISPASLAVAATCRMLAERESPFCYLGYIYLLESTTPVLTERVQHLMEKRLPGTTSKFVALHAKEDIKHQELIHEQVRLLTKEFPEASSEIDWAFDCFASVYPKPVWETALSRAKIEHKG